MGDRSAVLRREIAKRYDGLRVAAVRTSVTDRERPRIRDPERARAAILAAAHHIFNTKGYFATNSNEIAITAGYAPGSFYTHFPDKLTIFLEVYAEWVNQEWATIAAAMRSPGNTTRRIKAAIAALASNHRASRMFRRSLRALAATVAEVRNAQNTQRAHQMQWLKDLCAAEGWRRPTSETCAIVLLSIERVLDAVAEHDIRTLGADETIALTSLARMTVQLLATK